MKYTIAAITLACAFAAQDNTPPVISLNLASNYNTHTNYFNGAKYQGGQLRGQLHTSVAKSHTNSYARRCAVVTGTSEAAAAKACPSPDATAYDKHESDLTDKIQYSAIQFVTSAPGTRPVKTQTKFSMPNGKLAANAYSKRGEFVLTYNVADSSGNAAEELVFAMIMTDTKAPIIITTAQVTGNAQACMENRNPNRLVNRCIAKGFAPTASDAYDGTKLSSFTYTKGGRAMGSASATITLDIKSLGAKTLVFRATDFADIFGKNNKDNVAQRSLTITVVDTLRPRLLLRQFGDQKQTRACGRSAIKGVTDIKACRLHTLRKNLPGLRGYRGVLCAGCRGSNCYSRGTNMCHSINYGATAVAETRECAKAITSAESATFSTTGVAAATGAWCVDDRLSAKGMVNDESVVAASVKAIDGNFVPRSKHNKAFRYQYTCSDGRNHAIPVLRTVKVIDTTDPVLKITHLGFHNIARNNNNYRTHKKVGAAFTKDPWTDLLTVQHSAGYTEDARYIKGLTTARQGYTCNDKCDLDITNTNVKTEWFKCKAKSNNCCKEVSAKKDSKTKFFTLEKGDWAIVYTCTDNAGNKVQKCRNVRNEDHAKPIITIIGADVMVFEASSTANYVDAGATCQDEVDGNISQDVEVSGDVVNLARVGTYKIFYNCQDSAMNKADTAVRTVTVQDTSCPTCYFKNGRQQHRELTLEASFPYTDQFKKDVHCQDELTASIVPVATTYAKKVGGTKVASSKITATIGTYYTTYVATDDVGNSNEIGANGKGGNGCTFQSLDKDGKTQPLKYTQSMYTRTMKVVDTLKPVIKLALGGQIIKAGAAGKFPTGADAEYQKQATGFPAPDTGAHTQSSHTWKLMAEETTSSVNGWVLGAIASAVSGLALLGYSLRKQAQPVATSVPV